jgi:YHS domain-containing protein
LRPKGGATVIKLLLFCVIIYCGYKILKSAVKTLGFGGTGPSQVNASRGNVENVMIQDPVCKVYFARKDGVCHQIGGKELCFCSEECREKYLVAHE